MLNSQEKDTVIKLVDQFIKEELPDAKTDFHVDAEIAVGMNMFKKWLETQKEVK